MTDYIISFKLSNETVYACYRGRFWRWNGSIWKESHLMTQKFERAKAADKKLTPQEFLSNGAEFAPLDEYEIDCAMLDALKNAKPCRNAPDGRTPYPIHAVFGCCHCCGKSNCGIPDSAGGVKPYDGDGRCCQRLRCSGQCNRKEHCTIRWLRQLF